MLYPCYPHSPSQYDLKVRAERAWTAWKRSGRSSNILRSVYEHYGRVRTSLVEMASQNFEPTLHFEKPSRPEININRLKHLHCTYMDTLWNIYVHDEVLWPWTSLQFIWPLKQEQKCQKRQLVGILTVRCAKAIICVPTSTLIDTSTPRTVRIRIAVTYVFSRTRVFAARTDKCLQ